MGLQGKVIGMTDAEWTQQVNNNVARWSREEREKAQRLKNQRDQMRSELQQQIVQKAEKNKMSATWDRSHHNEQLNAMERKLLDEEEKNQANTDKIRTQTSINAQYNILNSYKNE